jgi:hypothetical protein
MTTKPWVSGPRELLNHAKEHINTGKPIDYRLAMISIDNSVELSIRTFLGLPKRIRGSEGPLRKELESAFGFPELLDLIEKYDEEHLSGIELGDIEWYHRLRNQLYHDGNGITVDPEIVDAYHQIAILLFQNLFETISETTTETSAATLLGNFVIKWASLEMRLRKLAEIYLPKHDRGYRTVISYFDGLIAKGVIPPTYRSQVDQLFHMRSSMIHSTQPPKSEEIKQYNELLDTILSELPNVENQGA